MTRTTQRRRTITRFEEHSLALFAALAMGATAAAHGQTQAPADGLVRTQATMGPGPAPSAKSARENLDAVFARADTNRDGKLSREEAVRLPAVSERFDEFDLDHDRFLSRTEFDKGVAR